MRRLSMNALNFFGSSLRSSYVHSFGENRIPGYHIERRLIECRRLHSERAQEIEKELSDYMIPPGSTKSSFLEFRVDSDRTAGKLMYEIVILENRLDLRSAYRNYKKTLLKTDQNASTKNHLHLSRRSP